MQVKTNRVPRPLINGFELTEKEKLEFDYIKGEDLDSAAFFRYKSRVYYLGNFMKYEQEHNGIKWHGYESDSFFSGTLVHICEDHDHVVVGRYCS